MCAPFSINDDQPPISPVAVALETLRAAESARFELAALVSEDAPIRLPAGLSLDQHIAKVVGAVTAARHNLDRAICTLMRGERFMPSPSDPAIKVEIQARITRNAGQPSYPYADHEAGFVSAARA